jgi:hypothetical protein
VAIDIVYSFFVSVLRVRLFKGSIDKDFPYVISL